MKTFRQLYAFRISGPLSITLEVKYLIHKKISPKMLSTLKWRLFNYVRWMNGAIPAPCPVKYPTIPTGSLALEPSG